MNFKHWLLQLIVACNQLVNVLGHFGSSQAWADETISASCGRLGHRYPYRLYKRAIDALFLWVLRQGPDHCDRAYENAKKRAYSPPEHRQPVK